MMKLEDFKEMWEQDGFHLMETEKREVGQQKPTVGPCNEFQRFRAIRSTSGTLVYDGNTSNSNDSTGHW